MEEHQSFANGLPDFRNTIPRCIDTVEFMAHARENLQRLQASGDTARAMEVCFALRWSQPRINEIADPCAGLLDRVRAGSGVEEFARENEGFMLHDIDRGLHRRIRDYLDNPYCPERTRALALSLAEHGFRKIADHLAPELLQLDIETAARLEHELAGLDPLPYPGFRLPE